MARPIRTPFSPIDEALHHLDCIDQPCSVHFEVVFDGHLDERRLREALGVAISRHPMARAKQLPWRPTDHVYTWEIPEAPELDPLSVLDSDDPKKLAETRAQLQSRSVSLCNSPPFRLVLAREAAGDRLILNLNHTAGDGVAAARLMRSLTRAYYGEPDPIPARDVLRARHLEARVEARVEARLKAVAPSARLAHMRILLDFYSRIAVTPARIAPAVTRPRPGYGFVLHRLSIEDTARLDPHRHTHGTVNDLLLAAMHLSIARWNHGRRAPCGDISLMMPVNLRPDDARLEHVGNFALFVPIRSTRTDRCEPARLLQAIATQTRDVKSQGTAEALLDMLGNSRWLPLWMKRSMALMPLAGDRFVDTAVLSNLGRVDSGIERTGRGAVREMWISPPARMPLGVGIGVLTQAGAMHITFRYCHALFDESAARAFADLFVDTLRSIG